MAKYFADYCEIVTRGLGDRVNTWCIFNEPWVFTMLGYAWGVHALYVTTLKPGVVELRLVGYDVLRRVRMPRTRKLPSGLLKVPVALREDATPFVRDYRTVPHQLTTNWS